MLKHIQNTLALLLICVAFFMLSACTGAVYEYGIPYNYNSSMTRINDPSPAGREGNFYQHYMPYNYESEPVPDQYLPNER